MSGMRTESIPHVPAGPSLLGGAALCQPICSARFKGAKLCPKCGDCLSLLKYIEDVTIGTTHR